MIGSLSLAYGTSDRPWRIELTRAADPARLCLGLRPDEAVQRVSTLFSLCGAAHAEAASVALGLAEPHVALSDAMRREILRDHAMALLLDLPPHLGLPPARDQLAALSRADRGGGDPSAMRQALTGTAADMSAFNEQDLDDWLEQARDPNAPIVVRVLSWIRHEIAPEWGRVMLPSVGTADIEMALAPDCQPEPREATILLDHAESPLLGLVLRREGRSLFARVLARLLDLLACLDPENTARGAPPMPRPIGARPIGGCIGLARAARGILVHQAEVVKGRITAYRILSPTFWNVMPGGLLASMLATLPTGPLQRPLARLVLTSINPCVPVTLAEA